MTLLPRFPVSDGRTGLLQAACCQCPRDSEPRGGDVAQGCALRSCGDTDGNGTSFACGPGMTLVANGSSVFELSVAACCECQSAPGAAMQSDKRICHAVG